MSATICYLCNKGEVVHDKKMSGMFCTGCGECFELGAFTDEVQYREDDRGRYLAIGSTYSVEKGFVNSKFSSHGQCLASVDNAKTILRRYCDKLYISESFAQISSGFYHQLLIKKYMNGRRLNVVLAACLYIAVRTEGANVILLDISDVAEANVYDIGRYYFQIIRLLHFNIQTVDPCEYIVRFVDMLNLGDRTLSQVKRSALSIRETANRIVQRMKRDWIHFGRRPSGVCAAAVLVAARINNVRCSFKDIISIAKVCESTIRKRIDEFIETPASLLTYEEFMLNDLGEGEDPPAFKRSATLNDDIEANLKKAEKYQNIIEEHLKESRVKLRGLYAKFLKDIFTSQDDGEKLKDDETSIIQETIIDHNILSIDGNITKMSQEMHFEDHGNPSKEEIEYWADLRPSAKSLGLLRREAIQNEANEYQDLLDKDLDEDIDDDEISAYIIDGQTEISQRQMEWTMLNREFLEKEAQELLKRKQQESQDENEKEQNGKTKKKRRKTDKVETSAANSASEAVKAAAKAKSIQLNSNLNLKELFNEESDASSQSKPGTSGIAVVMNQSNTNEVVDSQSDKEDTAHLVSLYHSYAKVPATQKSQKNITQKTDNNDQVSESTIKRKDEVIEIQHISVEDNGHNDVNDKKIKIPPKKLSTSAQDIDSLVDDDDDYFGEDDDNVDDDDDDDDEFQKIKQKYSLQGDNGYTDDFEDCGF
uniref:Transcription factor IIIB 90 kDa subunit-like isoform X1 n=2 Tax=Dermatophagoides pteronyssinus TaxID=6956 RepID=A0A6P6XYL2_DERPT|nr:transcription factor IIIB 90 kDa subunit-like isoform X1 [Dermatophagoides pteronyssinus]